MLGEPSSISSKTKLWHDSPFSGPRHEPIAIVGIGCRFPGGANSPESFWQLLHDSVDAIRETPADRMDVATYYDPRPAVPGKMMTRWGGFLEQIDEFDARFFGISPRARQPVGLRNLPIGVLFGGTLKEVREIVEYFGGKRSDPRIRSRSISSHPLQI